MAEHRRFPVPSPQQERHCEAEIAELKRRFRQLRANARSLAETARRFYAEPPEVRAQYGGFKPEQAWREYRSCCRTILHQLRAVTSQQWPEPAEPFIEIEPPVKTRRHKIAGTRTRFDRASESEHQPSQSKVSGWTPPASVMHERDDRAPINAPMEDGWAARRFWEWLQHWERGEV